MKPILVEGEHGHGALKSKIDLRDHQYEAIARSSVPFDWNVGFDSELDLGVSSETKDQGSSSSCGGQSGAYLDAILDKISNKTFKEKSAKYIYSQIYYPGGGTTLRDVLNLLVKRGSCSEATLPSYKAKLPPDEGFMEDRSGITAEASVEASQSAGQGYAFLATNIDVIAQAVRDNHGCILQVTGQNNGSWRSPFPVPPNSKTANWSHFLYVGKAKLIDGKKYVGIHNSWGPLTGENGWQWLSEDYFVKGFVTNAGVVYAKSNPIINNEAVEQQKTNILARILALIQQLINSIQGVTVNP